MLIATLQTELGLSEHPAWAAVGLERSVYHYEPRPNRDQPIIKLLLELAWQRPEQGFGKLFRRLRRMGHGWNHKRVYRIYYAPERQATFAYKMSFTSVAPERMNECWSAGYERCFVGQ